MENLSDNIRKQFDILEGQEMYFVNDLRNMEFFAKNPLNDNKEIIRDKVSAMNHKDINRLLAAEAMT